MNSPAESDSVLQHERDRLSRELHDHLGQTLTGLKMDVAWLARRLSTGVTVDADIPGRLAEMSHCLDAAVDDVRDIARWLRTPGISPEELSIEIDAQVRIMAARAGLMVFCDIHHPIPLPPALSMDLVRIVQESVTNIIRHASARAIWICLHATPGRIDLRIRDDGKGVPATAQPGAPASVGLTGMFERAHRLGAQLSIQQPPQGGTLVHLQIPLAARQPHNAFQATVQRKGA